ncbi:hypothetical protein GCM10008960_40620 [Deinococcus sedimenti]|uniref:HTH cro/C1-type domain-containing protein n=2 Tax=Deinococcus sedimenti TaxID=1867090 RepID=A0ABQ2S9B5_9DEIO|nr:hypothetical protein GCM10008960_40620 [Deinococcus sedimenti]
MTDVNQDVCRQVKAVMKEDGMTQEAVAQQMNVDRVYINRMLNNGTSKIPMRWGQLLDLLGLELVIRRKQDR